MLLKTKQVSFALLIILALTLNACGSSASNNSIIATSVAMTVQAQNSQAPVYTQTSLPVVDIPTLLTSPTSGVTTVPPTAPVAGSTNVKPCYSAHFVQDATIPDGTIMSPGESYWKTWSVQNTGSCTWNSSYNLIYIDGDIMGGGYVMNFPTVAAPDQTVDITLELWAPLDAGTYTGHWMIRSPDKSVTFGVGQYNQPLSVQVVVVAGTPANKKTASPYDVTNVTYNEVERVCKPANTFWYYSANISSNGPVDVIYSWQQSDGHNYNNKKLSFTDATTISTSPIEWSQGIASATNPRWVRVVITSPTYHEWPELPIPSLCAH
jgi:hypothetical protein